MLTSILPVTYYKIKTVDGGSLIIQIKQVGKEKFEIKIPTEEPLYLSGVKVLKKWLRVNRGYRIA